jgi:transposase
MEKIDTRKLKTDALHERRKQVIRLYKLGHNRNQIRKMCDLSHTVTTKIIKLYEQGGTAALKLGQRGRRSGEDRKLTAEQELCIQSLICEKRPEQLKMDFALWSRAAVGELIEQQYQIRLPVRTVGLYLSRWGFTPQKPIKRAYEQSPAAVQTWLKESYPDIAKRAKAEGGEINWVDETAVVNTDVRGRSFAPKGKTPVTMAVGGTRQKLSLIASVTNQGKARWMIIDGAFNHERLIEFFELLIKDAGRKVFLILDNLSVHHCKPVKAWVAERQAQIELFYLPSYSPELNPEERLNADLKQVIRRKVPVRSKDKLRTATEEHMNDIASKPERVKTYFQDPFVKYAA